MGNLHDSVRKQNEMISSTVKSLCCERTEREVILTATDKRFPNPQPLLTQQRGRPFNEQGLAATELKFMWLFLRNACIGGPRISFWLFFSKSHSGVL